MRNQRWELKPNLVCFFKAGTDPESQNRRDRHNDGLPALLLSFFLQKSSTLCTAKPSLATNAPDSMNRMLPTKIWRFVLVSSKYARSIFICFVVLNPRKYRSGCIRPRSHQGSRHHLSKATFRSPAVGRCGYFDNGPGFFTRFFHSRDTVRTGELSPAPRQFADPQAT